MHQYKISKNVKFIQWKGDNIKEIDKFIKVEYLIDFDQILCGSKLGVAYINDYIIQLDNGDYFVCKPKIFNGIFERV